MRYPAPRRRLTVFAAVILLLFCLFPGKAAVAHFKLNLNIRIIHIEHTQQGLNLYIRLPMPYLVAALVGPELADGTREPAPFTSNALVDGQWLHYVDIQALLLDPRGLGQMAVDGHRVTHSGQSLPLELGQVRVYDAVAQPPFSTLDEAQRAFTAPYRLLPADPAPFVGDTVVDVLVHARSDHRITRYAISSTLDPGLPEQNDTANLILDYAEGRQRIFRLTGLLQKPFRVGSTAWEAARTFLSEGVRHILGGYDHVLYVACLVMAAATLGVLAWQVTGFTLGHSVTLSLGYFGWVPAAAWFVPLVETGIALSIIYAALLALSSETASAHNTRGNHASVMITTAIGLLHGLGFSFVLQDMLGNGSASIWSSLLFFNLGVEIGQLGIVLLIWLWLLLLRRQGANWLRTGKWLLALPAIVTASIWTGERLIMFGGSLQG